MKRTLFTLLAVIEIVAVFALTLLATRAASGLALLADLRTQWPEPVFDLAFRWLPLIALALGVDLALRRRGFFGWGLAGPPAFDAIAAAQVLFLGGIAPLALTLLSPPESGADSALHGSPAGIVAAFVIPLLGQEMFIAGYARTRLADHAPTWLAVLIVAGLFALAHLQHAATGALGIAFVASMAWQGALWALARRAGVSLLTLMAAHLALLAAYEAPMVGAGVVLALGIIALVASPRRLATFARGTT